MKLAPGVRLNFSQSGCSWTLGPRGASVNVGSRGSYLNTGLPGFGLYSRKRFDSSPRRSAQAPLEKVETSVRIIVGNDGRLSCQDLDGNPLPESVLAQAKKQRPEAIRDLLADTASTLNQQVEALGRVHLDTPRPLAASFVSTSFDQIVPEKPIPIEPGLFARLWKPSLRRIEARNQDSERRYEHALLQWNKERQEHEILEARRKQMIEKELYEDVALMEVFLEERLSLIEWPRETCVSFDIGEKGQSLRIDVDLPEVEDLPRRTTSAPSRGFRLSIKAMSDTQVRKLYAEHVHSIVFRILGEAFAALPTIRQIALSGYSQRPDAATGKIRDEYLISVRAPRERWVEIDFGALDSVDLIVALERFDLRRLMSKTGIFKSIEPFGMSQTLGN
ncbi:MAG: DUF4236 domain-containing protein [Burkholderiales bacterium]|nr:DUF4236 domain-containing protein [Burkholderiales bacterium]